MADIMSKAQRRKNMQAIKSRSKLEDRVSKALWHKGFRFRKNARDLMGKPDISIKKYKVVIFVDSCFWHQCPIHGNTPENNRDFWEEKLAANKERDKKVTNYYEEEQWTVIRIWEHDLKKDFETTINQIEQILHDLMHIQS